MRRTHVQGFRGLIILAAVMGLGLTGCDYWPPALLAQLEQLRNHVQDISDERSRLETQLRESVLGKDDLQVKLQKLSDENQTLRDRIAHLEKKVASRKSTRAVASKSVSSKRIARTPSRARAARVLAVQRPPMTGKDVKAVQRGLKRIGGSGRSGRCLRSRHQSRGQVVSTQARLAGRRRRGARHAVSDRPGSFPPEPREGGPPSTTDHAGR